MGMIKGGIFRYPAKLSPTRRVFVSIWAVRKHGSRIEIVAVEVRVRFRV
jgi:hypothetical protein